MCRLVLQIRVSAVSARGLSVVAESSPQSAGPEALKLDASGADGAGILKRRKKVDPKVLLRQQYAKSLSELRKEYAEAEVARKRKAEKKRESAELQVMLERGKRAALREERTRVRAMQTEEVNKASRAARVGDLVCGGYFCPFIDDMSS